VTNAIPPIDFETPPPANEESPPAPPPPWEALVIPVTSAWYTTKPPPRRWLLRDGRTGRGALPLGRVAFVVGAGGTSKTMSFVQLALAVSTGTPWLGSFEPAPEGVGRALLILGEEDADEAQRRLYHARQVLNAAPEDGRIIVVPLSGQSVPMIERDGNGNPVDAPFLLWLRDYVQTIPDLRLVVADPFSRFGGLEAEKDNAMATRAIEAFESIAVPSGATVLAGHHSAQWARGAAPAAADARASVARGVTGITDGARWVAGVTTEHVGGLDADAQERLGRLVTIAPAKSNYSRDDWEPIVCRRNDDGVLVPLDDTDREIIARAREASSPEAKGEARRKQARVVEIDATTETVVRLVSERPGITWTKLLESVMATGATERVARAAIAKAHDRLDAQKGARNSTLYYPRSTDT
jgi:hypothetical protein